MYTWGKIKTNKKTLPKSPDPKSEVEVKGDEETPNEGELWLQT